ncbi:YuzF family protein [Paenibacillus larvae]|uniref:DUF2642 domain-containing protein n=1 Tax=Paenibacillus larvae TaxID=1464 RepID=UPI00227E946A|nr:DUF2642 domain-containing protein [Paenibacillus larvae]MCY9512425.1 YuzF family protein [Paenibacillus larvae]MCY9527435.1 YuzF family protein [Paenibacillus larvae]
MSKAVAVYDYPHFYGAPMQYLPYYRNGSDRPMESTILPKTIVYLTKVDPKIIEHLQMHKGQKIHVITTVGKLEGKLDNVYIDHITLISHGKKLHIRIHEIVYFEKA